MTENNNVKLVALTTTNGEANALVVKSKLESFAIPALIVMGASPSVHPFTVDGLGQATIMVREVDLTDAQNIIFPEILPEDLVTEDALSADTMSGGEEGFLGDIWGI